jgi:hypothetical protein
MQSEILYSILESFFGIFAEIRSVQFIPLLYPTIHVVFLITVSFLDDAEKFDVITFGFQKIVIRQLTPFLLDVSFELLPPSLKLFLIHKKHPLFLVPLVTMFMLNRT